MRAAPAPDLRLGRVGLRPARRVKLGGTALALLAFLAATNRYVRTHEDIYVLHQWDSLSYRELGVAAPGLLHHRVQEWYAERFGIHWVVGSAAKLFGVSLTAAYFAAVGIVLLGLLTVLAGLMSRVGVSRRAGVVCMAALILNPYSLRGFLVSPAGVADLVFILGIAIALRGLVLGPAVTVVGGLVLATIARQTTIPAAITVAVVMAMSPGWRALLGSGLLARAGVVAAAPIGCYALIRVIAHPFSGPSPTLHTMTLLGAPTSPRLLVEHFARCLIVIAPVSALLVVSWWAARDRREKRDRAWDRLAPARTGPFACLAVGASIIVQPIVLNPVWAARNENRLTALGLLPLVVGLALLIARWERSRGREISARTMWLLLAILAAGSFHHFYTWLRLADANQTIALQLAVAIALVVAFIASESSGAWRFTSPGPR